MSGIWKDDMSGEATTGATGASKRTRASLAAAVTLPGASVMSETTQSEIPHYFDPALPAAQGLYDPANEKDSCGVGFVANMHNLKSHDIVSKGLEILLNLDHRGAVGADPKAGDGCGMLVQIPDRFLRDEAQRIGFTLPAIGDYAVGALFLPRDAEGRAIVEKIVEDVVAAEGQTFLGWRDVPVDPSGLGESVKPTEPVHRQIFIQRGASAVDQDVFERKLFLLRKVISNTVYNLNDPRTKGFYPVSLSSRTLVYKGMLLATQLGDYFLDLRDERMESAISLVHQRFSTNTFPTWSLAHPYRMVAHNGEINTLRGNVNWMAARQASVASDLFGDDIQKLWPISYEGQSDTACFDNALEFLVQGGYSLAHAMMMLIPEAWAGNPLMDEERRAFYEYHAALMEPWDGPAAVAFTDGRQIGATLDRNGLRPARYLVTDDGLVVMASEMGVLPDPGGEDRHQVAAAAGQDAAHRSRAGPHHLRRRDEAHALAPRIPIANGSTARRSCWRTCPNRSRPPRVAHRRVAARSPAGLRLHAGGPVDPDGADGHHRPGSRRLDGHRHADLGAVEQVEAALYLFQAELRAGDEPADRPDPRRARDEPGLVHRAAAEPARPSKAIRSASGSRCASRSSPTAISRRSAASAISRIRSTPRRSTSPTPSEKGASGHGGGARAPVRARPRRRSRAATTSSSCRTAWSAPTASRSRRCWRRRPCIIT